MLIKACLNREVPPGKAPRRRGVPRDELSSVAFIANYLKTGMPLVAARHGQWQRRRIAEERDRAHRHAYFRADRLLRRLQHGAEKRSSWGGPMMGLAVTGDDLPVLKQNNAILAFGGKRGRPPEADGLHPMRPVVAGCPMRLVPTMLEKLTEQKDVDGLLQYGVTVCMECGICAFNCPAGRRLVQSISLRKSFGKSRLAAKKKG